MVKLIPYSGKKLWIWEHPNTHPSFRYFVDVISSQNNATLETRASLLPLNSAIGALVEQPNSYAYEFYRDIKKSFAKDTSIVALASARWHWTQEDAQWFGIAGIVLWEPRKGKINETDVVHKGYCFYPAQEKVVNKDYLILPQRETEPQEPQRMVSKMS